MDGKSCQNADVGRKTDGAGSSSCRRNQTCRRAIGTGCLSQQVIGSLHKTWISDVREPLSVIQGPASGIRFPGYHVRAANEADLNSCNQLCYKRHGHDRSHELSGAMKTGTSSVVEYDGMIIGYTTQVGFLGHTISLTNTGLKALIGASANFSGPGFLLPSRNAEVLRWCLQNGLRIVEPMTLMSKGLYI